MGNNRTRHGGKDPGTTYKNIYEKDLNLNISNKIKNQLEKYGAIVIMTRYGDYDLSSPNAMFRKKNDFDNRILLINNSKANAYLSIHLNYLDDSRYSGVQVFYNLENKRMASHFQTEINNMLNSNKMIRQIPKGTYMYDKLQISGILIECGFLSNSNEREMLLKDEYQQKLAIIISDALVTYFT